MPAIERVIVVDEASALLPVADDDGFAAMGGHHPANIIASPDRRDEPAPVLSEHVDDEGPVAHLGLGRPWSTAGVATAAHGQMSPSADR